MNLAEYATFDGLALAELIRKKEVSAQEVCTLGLQAIGKLNPILNFAIQTFPERVEALAHTPPPPGPFAGLPMLLKDFYKFEKGVISECGCMLTKGLVGSYDSEVVLRLRRAGFVTVGRSAVPEFGWSLACNTEINGLTRNPWNLDTYPGGSSSGAGVAVASGALPIAHASDGGGSTRGPASYCGLVGLKATRARVSDGPGVADPNAGTSAHLGLTRTVRDTAALLDAMSGPAVGDPHQAPRPERPFLEELGRAPRRLRIAFTTTAFDGSPVDPEVAAAVVATAKLLVDMGHDVDESTPEHDWDEFILSTMTIWAASITHSLDGFARQLGRTPSPENLTRTTWAMYQHGQQLSASDYLTALDQANRLRRQIGPFFERYDILLTPSTAQTAKAHATMDQNQDLDAEAFTRLQYHSEVFLPFANTTGQPAISLPLFQARNGNCIGVQLVGRFGDDATLLRLSSQLETALPWGHRKPPVHLTTQL